MNNIKLLQDKDINYFIIYFYFVLFLYLLSLWFIWSFGRAVNIYKEYEKLWLFDEVLYAYLIWPFFSLLNLSYITFKSNKVKLYFTISLIIFISSISIYFILSIENIYRLNFPHQFSLLYINSIVFVITIILIFIYFSRTLLKNNFNKHNFILLNSYFFLIVIFIAMLFIVVNKPPLVSDYPYSLSVIMNLRISFLFLFIPFLNFLFLFLIYFFFKKHKIILIVIITVIAFWDILLGLITEPLLTVETFLQAFLRIILYFNLANMIFMSLIFGIGIPLYYRMLRSHSSIQMVVLLNMVMMLIYLTLFSYEDASIIEPIIFLHLDPVYDLASSIIIIILFLIIVNLAIYLKGKLTLKTLI